MVLVRKADRAVADDVTRLDDEEINSTLGRSFEDELVERQRKIEATTAMLDGDLPRADDTEEKPSGRIFKRARNRFGKKSVVV